MSICAILPIKHKSSRIPGKNYRDFNGKPLFTVILDTLIKCNIFNEIIIDTNSEIVKDIVNSDYKNYSIRIYDRPEHLWDGDIPMNIILENVILSSKLNYDLYLQTHTTNPLLSKETILDSVKTFRLKEKEEYDSLFSVKKLQTRLYRNENDKVIALNHNPNELLPTQDLEPLYEENSCIFIFKKDILIKKKHRIGYKPYMYVMDDIQSSDIDIETDFIIAESLYKCMVIDKKNKDKVVLVTGASGGIGSSICKRFKNDGWTVIGTARENNYKSENIDMYIHADITKEKSIKNLVDTIKTKYTKISCLVNNAAAQICKPIWEMEESEWDYVFNCNIKSIYLFVKNVLDLMKNNNSSIINIGSVHSVNTSDEIAAYATTKSAIVGLTRNLAIELSKFDIRVNCISPGAVDTEMLRSGLLRGHAGKGTPEELVIKLGKTHLLGKVGQPIEIANLVKFVADNDNGKFINGSNILIDGGASIKLSTE